jgi:hypothetical protein
MRKFVSLLTLVALVTAGSLVASPRAAMAGSSIETHNPWARLGGAIFKFLRDKAPYIYIMIDEFLEDLSGCNDGNAPPPPPPPPPTNQP